MNIFSRAFYNQLQYIGNSPAWNYISQKSWNRYTGTIGLFCLSHKKIYLIKYTTALAEAVYSILVHVWKLSFCLHLLTYVFWLCQWCFSSKNVRDRSTDNTETTCGKKITFPVEPKLHSCCCCYSYSFELMRLLCCCVCYSSASCFYPADVALHVTQVFAKI